MNILILGSYLLQTEVVRSLFHTVHVFEQVQI